MYCCLHDNQSKEGHVTLCKAGAAPIWRRLGSLKKVKLLQWYDLGHGPHELISPGQNTCTKLKEGLRQTHYFPARHEHFRKSVSNVILSSIPLVTICGVEPLSPSSGNDSHYTYTVTMLITPRLAAVACSCSWIWENNEKSAPTQLSKSDVLHNFFWDITDSRPGLTPHRPVLMTTTVHLVGKLLL